jgi:hypothetical protein
VTTYLYQTNLAPWDEGRLQVDPQTKQAAPSPADDARVEELARRILGETAAGESALPTEALRGLLQATRSLGGRAAPGLFRSDGPRARQRAGSPVQSNRFL